MDRDAWRERMIETLLEEELGSKRCPDLTESVMAAVQQGVQSQYPTRKPELSKEVIRRVGPRLKWSAAIAAVLVLGLSVALGIYVIRSLRTEAYPGAEATGGLRMAKQIGDQPKLLRGKMLVTDSKPGVLKIGGYVVVEVAPDSAMVWKGQPNAEVIALNRGSIVNRVNKERQGSFEVKTSVGTVKTIGTEFEVKLIEEGESDMKIKSMMVKVMVGAVLVTGSFGSETIYAGDEKKFTEKNKHETLVKKIAEREKHNGLQLKSKSGTLAGIVQRVDGNRFFLQTAKYPLPIAFGPQWKGGMPKDGGGLDKKILGQIKALKRGDKVSVKYVFDERPRAMGIKNLGRASKKDMEKMEVLEAQREKESKKENKKQDENPWQPDEKNGKDQLEKQRGRAHEVKTEEVVRLKNDAKAEIERINKKEKHNGMQLLSKQEGIIIGEVVEVDGNRVWVKSSAFKGNVAFAPRWLSRTKTWAGGLDTTTQKTIKGLKRGDRIRFAWAFDERPRMVWVKKLSQRRYDEGDGAP